MNNWENGKQRLFAELGRIYDGIGTELGTELQELHGKCSRIDQLVEDNARLRQELETSRKTQLHELTGPQEDDSVQELKRRNADLVERHNRMCKQWELQKDLNAKLKTDLAKGREKVEETHKKIKQWQDFNKHQEELLAKKTRIIQKLKEKLQALNTPHCDGLDGMSRGGIDVDEFKNGDIPTEPPRSPELPKLKKTIVHDSEDEEVPYHDSNSTEEDPNPAIPGESQNPEPSVKEEPLDDEDIPVILSVRRVGKRKSVQEADVQRSVSLIKYETLSSSPIGLAGLRYLDPNESIDLDDIGNKVDTPKKRHHLLEKSQGRRAFSHDLDQIGESHSQDPGECILRAASEQLLEESQERRVGVPRKGSALRPMNANKQILPRTSDHRAAKKRRIASDEAVGEIMEDGEVTPPAGSNRKKNLSKSSEKLVDLLSNPSPQRTLLSPTLLRKPIRPQSALSIHRDDAHSPSITIKSLGQESATKVRHTVGGSEEQHRLSSKASLEDLRTSIGFSTRTPNNPRSMRQSLHNTTSASVPAAQPVPRASSGVGDSPKSASAKTYSRSSMATPRPDNFRQKPRRKQQNEAELEFDPEQEPLRLRPLESLRLDDFKINPYYNQGYSHAYSDVVRNKDERRCLQGCVKPGCCGDKFRLLAKMARPVDQSLTLSQEEEDERILNEFMGDNAYKLQSMSKAQREETLLQARTRDLSNKYSKHRNAYARPASPPGFWRADFPTTQEELQDRQKAKTFELAEIKHRYEEAMRPKGAFMFRDE